MYNVTKQNHPQYGNVIEIIRDEAGPAPTPFQAEQLARKEYRLWKESGTKKIRFLIDQQIVNLTELTHWSHEEYKSLSKCQECGKILSGDVYTHSLSGDALFCRQACADANYDWQVDHLSDCEECDL